MTFLCTPVFWNVFVCPLLFHMLRVYPHFNRFCHLQPKVLSSLSRSLPDPFLSGTSVSVTDTQAGSSALSHCTSKRLSRICTQGQQHYAKHKTGLLEHVERCCWWKTPCLPLRLSTAPAITSLVWQETCGTAPRKAERAGGEYKAKFSKINAIRACTQLSSWSYFQEHWTQEMYIWRYIYTYTHIYVCTLTYTHWSQPLN